MKITKPRLACCRHIVEITLILVLVFSVRYWMQRDLATGAAPDFQARLLNGQQFDLYKDKRRPILVHFWATWCPVCQLEYDSINNISADYPVITIAMQSGDDEELSKYMLNQSLKFNVINDNNGVISQKYNIKGVPVSFILDKDNKIKFTEVGYTTEIGLRLRLWWAE